MKEKANYCLNCKNKPCQKACPLGNDIPGFIEKMKEEDYKEAYKILTKTTLLSAICGRICPHQSQCEGSCTRGYKANAVEIGELEAFVADKALTENYEISLESEDVRKQNENKKIAIVGGGPAGITAAAFLARKGYKVTIFDKHEKLGGVLAYGIPEFRLEKELLQNNIDKILNLGIEKRTNIELGEDISLEELEKEYDAVFLGLGANVSSKMRIIGEELEGVYGGNELLETGNHPDYIGKRVAVNGGGNVAMDVARSIKRLGAKEVKIVYRRAEKQMPAERKEIEEAKQEGVEFLFQNNIVQILPDIANKKIEKLELIKTELIKKEGELRESPVNIEGSNYIIPIDMVIMAIGGVPDRKLMQKLELATSSKGYMEVNEKYQTSRKKIFSAGDIIGGKATVAWAARTGRNAGEEIDRFLQRK